MQALGCWLRVASMELSWVQPLMSITQASQKWWRW
jgi:hypothetical protein